MMIGSNNRLDAKRAWVEPQIQLLDVRETAAFPGVGNDVGGNPSPDCQRS